MISKMKLPEPASSKDEISFWEKKRQKWKIVLEVSESALQEENEPEFIRHWKKTNEDAKERIKEIDEILRLLRRNLNFRVKSRLQVSAI